MVECARAGKMNSFNERQATGGFSWMALRAIYHSVERHISPAGRFRPKDRRFRATDALPGGSFVP